MDVPIIRSERLDLVSLSPEFMLAALAGHHADAEAVLGARMPANWSRERERTLRLRLGQLQQDPTLQQWLLRAMVLREPDRRMIGHIGFHLPPDARGALEVGYAVEREHRRRGFAREAVRALLAWATRMHGIRLFVASISLTNAPSLQLIRQLGFHQTGTQLDEIDGLELVFELEVGDQASGR